MNDQPTHIDQQPWHVACARWAAATIFTVYGFAKLNGSQFTILDSELTKPMGEVSGFWLTWHYFGFSQTYGTFIALLQISGAILLTIPRTSLAGALFLLPVITNIILIDVFFGIGAFSIAVLLLLCLLVVIQPHAKRLLKAILLNDSSGHRGTIVRAIAAIGILFLGWASTYWIAHYNNRAPTIIDGIWTADDRPFDSEENNLRRVFFEYNRANMAVFRSSNSEDQRRHFEVGENGSIQIWERWRQKGPLLYIGHLEEDPRRIELSSVGDRSSTILLFPTE